MMVQSSLRKWAIECGCVDLILANPTAHGLPLRLVRLGVDGDGDGGHGVDRDANDDVDEMLSSTYLPRVS